MFRNLVVHLTRHAERALMGTQRLWRQFRFRLRGLRIAFNIHFRDGRRLLLVMNVTFTISLVALVLALCLYLFTGPLGP